jgi:hypothetical protein
MYLRSLKMTSFWAFSFQFECYAFQIAIINWVNGETILDNWKPFHPNGSSNLPRNLLRLKHFGVNWKLHFNWRPCFNQTLKRLERRNEILKLQIIIQSYFYFSFNHFYSMKKLKITKNTFEEMELVPKTCLLQVSIF